MNKYINKLKESSELRNKMTLHFDEEPGFSTLKTTMLTYLTDSDEECNNVNITVNHVELIWDGWDPEFKVVSVKWEKYIYKRLIKEQKFLALYDGDEYYVIPNSLAKKEKLEI